MPLHPGDLQGADLVLQIEIDWAGGTIRLSDVDHTGPFGDLDATVPFWGVAQFDPAWELSIPLFSGRPSDRSMDVIAWLGDALNVPDAVTAVGDPIGLPARVYAHPLGSSKRSAVLIGSVSGFAHGSKDEPARFKIEQDTAFDRGSIGLDLGFVNANSLDDSNKTWDWDTDVESEAYPIVIGKPGPGDGTAFGSPAFGCSLVSPATDLALIAGHQVVASSVNFQNFTTAHQGAKSVSHYNDEAGQRFAVCAANAWADGDEMWIDWGGSGGGMLDVDGTLLRGAGAVLRWMLSRSSVSWDPGRTAIAERLLQSYLIDVGIQPAALERIRPFEWAATKLVPFLPVSLVYGPEGVYPIVWRTDATSADAVRAFEVGQDCDRIGPVEFGERDDLINDITLHYGWDARTNTYKHQVRFTGDPSIAVGVYDYAHFSDRCRRSMLRYGRRPVEISAPITWDEQTAIRIAAWRAHAFALPLRSLTLAVRREAMYLEPGDVVTITDADLGWTSEVALVESVRLSSLDPQIRLRLYEP